ncbi:hypothetical protein BHE74_00021076 [Ensete ventricosum]|nr:hypothetical protein BHE74_00021076 [Ensete ventricosum]RZR99464.1 hypothetical protein BHM03_00029012 [Ensete ventricosum]
MVRMHRLPPGRIRFNVASGKGRSRFNAGGEDLRHDWQDPRQRRPPRLLVEPPAAGLGPGRGRRVLIDRNPACFVVLLDLLRTCKLHIPANMPEKLLYRRLVAPLRRRPPPAGGLLVRPRSRRRHGHPSRPRRRLLRCPRQRGPRLRLDAGGTPTYQPRLPAGRRPSTLSYGGSIYDFSIGGDRLYALHSEEKVFDVWETPPSPISESISSCFYND